MTSWEEVKDLRIDLNKLSDNEISNLVNSFDQKEVTEILSELEKAGREIDQSKEFTLLALRIAQIILTRGVMI